MIKHEMNPDSPVPFAALIVGEHIKIVENPKMTAHLPYWLQELMLNDTFDKATPNPPRRGRYHMAPVVPISVLRAAREARVGM